MKHKACRKLFYQPPITDMSSESTRPNRAAKMVPRRTILYPKLGPEVNVLLLINFA